MSTYIGDVTDSGNDNRNTTTDASVVNSAAWTATATGSFNDTDTTTDSGNSDEAYENIGNDYSQTSTWDNDVWNTDNSDDSDNSDNSNNSDNSDNSDNSNNSDNSDNSDNSVDSVSWTNSSTNDSNNSWEFNDDHSFSIGDRSYGAAGAAGGAGGTVVDQSINGYFSGGSIDLSSANHSVVASGEGSTAAGGDISIDYDVDASTNFTAGGDVNINNDTSTVHITDSYNTETTTVTETDSSEYTSWVDSGNTDVNTWSAEGSFNDSSTYDESWTLTADVDAIIDSNDSAIVGDVDLSL